MARTDVESIADRLRAAITLLRRHLRRADMADLQLPQLAILMRLSRAEGMTSADLARALMYLGAMAAAAASGSAFHVRAGTPELHVLGLVMVVAAVLFLLITVIDRSLGRLDAALRRVSGPPSS